jgi:restriction system protein
MEAHFMNAPEFWPDPESSVRATFIGRKREVAILRNELLGSEPKAVCITGLRGIGKTSLAMFFAETSKTEFPGGVYQFHASPFETINETVDRTVNEDSHPYLIVMDDVHLRPHAEVPYEIATLRHRHTTARIIFTSDGTSGPIPVDINVQLGGLMEREAHELIQRRLSYEQGAEGEHSLFHASKGHPLALTLAAAAMDSEKLSPRELLQRLQAFTHGGHFDSKGDPVPDTSERHKRVVADVITASDEFLKKLSDNPGILHQLSPRGFEELVAELLSRLGYGVTLTPASKDGGKDIYAAKQDHLGTFLYVVECKKYAPDHPVGVGLVRQLSGVVHAEQATAGILATTSFFTRGAKEFQRQMAFQISLKDYFGITGWLRAVVK